MKVVDIYENNDCTKLIFELDDGYLIENCFKYPFWLCITTQVGCPVGCLFCKSGSMGFKRNLNVSELMEQIKLSLVYAVGALDFKLMFINSSFTGMGEPLLNIENVIKVINELQINSDTNISITTTGIVKNIEKLFFVRKKIALDISLHSFDNETRGTLIPYEKTNPINETIVYVLKHKNRFNKITFDYMLLKGINDTEKDLYTLISKFSDKNVNIELKKYNKYFENDLYEMANKNIFEKFYHRIRDNNINVSIEKNVGLELNAGCGQLVWSKYNLQ